MSYGTSGNQFKNAGAIGPMMADLVDYCESGLDHDTKGMSEVATEFLLNDLNYQN